MPSNPQKKVQGFDEFWASNPQNHRHQLAGASWGLFPHVCQLQTVWGLQVLIKWCVKQCSSFLSLLIWLQGLLPYKLQLCIANSTPSENSWSNNNVTTSTIPFVSVYTSTSISGLQSCDWSYYTYLYSNLSFLFPQLSSLSLTLRCTYYLTLRDTYTDLYLVAPHLGNTTPVVISLPDTEARSTSRSYRLWALPKPEASRTAQGITTHTLFLYSQVTCTGRGHIPFTIL